MEVRIASKILAIVRIVTVTVGIAAAFYCLFGGNPELALHIVTLSTVGVVGLLSFASHVIFYKSDAERLGWSSDHPAFQVEVGFANLAFALAAFTAFFLNWGVATEAAIVLGYALYLVQAMLRFTCRVAAEHNQRLWLNLGTFFLYSVMLLIFMVAALQSADLPPFIY